MINIKITKDSSQKLYREVQNKINGSKELTSTKTRGELLDAVFSLSSLEFLKDTNIRARSFPKKYHHVYDWGQVGKESGRLFRLVHTKRGTSSSVYYTFNNSRRVVPVSSNLKTPGKTGKYVRKSKIFKRKAEVMESGSPVGFTTSKTIVFSGPEGLVFVPPGKSIYIKSPGGEETNNAFSEHFLSWWMVKPEQIALKNNIYAKLENSVAKSLNVTGAGRSAASSSISRTLRPYKLSGSVI